MKNHLTVALLVCSCLGTVAWGACHENHSYGPAFTPSGCNGSPSGTYTDTTWSPSQPSTCAASIAPCRFCVQNTVNLVKTETTYLNTLCSGNALTSATTTSKTTKADSSFVLSCCR